MAVADTPRTETTKQEAEKEARPGLTLLCNTAIPQPSLIPVSITQLAEPRPILLTALRQLHPKALLTLIQQLVSHQAVLSARVCILDSKMWSLALAMTYISNIT